LKQFDLTIEAPLEVYLISKRPFKSIIVTIEECNSMHIGQTELFEMMLSSISLSSNFINSNGKALKYSELLKPEHTINSIN
jgi:hypothetical protein